MRYLWRVWWDKRYPFSPTKLIKELLILPLTRLHIQKDAKPSAICPICSPNNQPPNHCPHLAL